MNSRILASIRRRYPISRRVKSIRSHLDVSRYAFSTLSARVEPLRPIHVFPSRFASDSCTVPILRSSEEIDAGDPLRLSAPIHFRVAIQRYSGEDSETGWYLETRSMKKGPRRENEKSIRSRCLAYYTTGTTRTGFSSRTEVAPSVFAFCRPFKPATVRGHDK